MKLDFTERELKDLWTACVCMFDELNCDDDFKAAAERYEYLLLTIGEAIRELRKEEGR